MPPAAQPVYLPGKVCAGLHFWSCRSYWLWLRLIITWRRLILLIHGPLKSCLLLDPWICTTSSYCDTSCMLHGNSFLVYIPHACFSIVIPSHTTCSYSHNILNCSIQSIFVSTSWLQFWHLGSSLFRHLSSNLSRVQWNICFPSFLFTMLCCSHSHRHRSSLVSVLCLLLHVY